MNTEHVDDMDLDRAMEAIKNWRDYPEVVRLAEDDPELMELLDNPQAGGLIVDLFRQLFNSEWS